MCLVGVTAVSLLAGCSSGNSGQSGDAQQETQTEAQSTNAAQNEADTSTASTPDTAAQDGADAAAEADTTAESDTEEVTDNVSDTGNVLVVYYSATGNTEEVANMIADTTGGDVFELEPTEPYTDDDLNWTDDNSRVSLEYADESLREVELAADTVENWNDYDTVFIGYPIWWGIAAWPVDNFIEANDFTGKTVIPFCTSSSSGMGQSGELLAELAGTGDWQEGHRFSSRVSEADVEEWLSTLGLS